MLKRRKESEEDSTADESHSADWKLQYFIYFHRDLSTPAMSTDSSQVDVLSFLLFNTFFIILLFQVFLLY